MSRRTVLAATLLPLALVVSGCAGTDAPDDPAASGSPASRAQDTPESEATTSPPAEPAGTTLAVQVAGGRVTGDTGRVTVPLGDPVTVTITSDAPDEAHLHGYDVTADLAAGAPTELAFDATVPGVFELELHEAGTVLLTLQVS
ncbi:cupredoxin domain-containing protein [Blastococcus goldschmidtiae]|uniref:EfeO-type cupredoxin-like domain-containing protein n=1 Tax=Blastococcus goldschmidtiae TaxID=3075546 RepID=A0ABU2KD80_9ACTN|nr:hypothetical protein [Blastococcus sp. DSM 46792]MDT0278149.1 hypothetical protein [Blastococcus sp. DSM 46792]